MAKFSVSWRLLVVLIVATSHFAIATSKKKGPNRSEVGLCSCPCPCNATRPPAPRTLVVGGSKYWDFNATNYFQWAVQNGPYFAGDTLVFKYAAHHNVVLINDFESYQNCNVSGANVLADTNAGAGDGFKFKLEALPFGQVYYFACGMKNGIHCNFGNMKFPIFPFPRPL